MNLTGLFEQFMDCMKAAQSSETLVTNHHTTWHNNPENHKFYKL
jgi:hypothetical protein